MPVDAESRQAFLCIGGKHGSEIHCARAFGGIQAPYSLDGIAVRIHGFRTVAPARCNGESNGNAFFTEFCFTGSCLCNTADRSVGDDYLHRFAVGVTQILLKQPGCGLCHVHGLVFQAFTHSQRAATAVNNRADTDYRVVTDITIFCHKKFSFVSLIFYYDKLIIALTSFRGKRFSKKSTEKKKNTLQENSRPQSAEIFILFFLLFCEAEPYSPV